MLQKSKDTERANKALLEQHESLKRLSEGGTVLADKFSLACGVRSNPDVFVAACMFRKQKSREFWNYMLFLIIFSASTLQQRPVERTHDFISHVVSGTVMAKGLTSVSFFKDLTGVASVEDFWCGFACV